MSDYDLDGGGGENIGFKKIAEIFLSPLFWVVVGNAMSFEVLE